MKKKFLKFIKDNNFYDTFLNHYDSSFAGYDTLDTYLDHEVPEFYLLEAFSMPSKKMYVKIHELNDLWNNKLNINNK